MDRKWWTLIAVCIGTFMLLLDVSIVNVALPSIQTALTANFSDLQWVIDAYALTLAALLLTSGSLADLWGRRRIFVIGLVVFTASSLASGLAQSPLWLNLARGAQGIGASAVFSTSLALLGHSFRGRERGMAFGVWGAITGLAVAVGPLVGGALTSWLSWRWIFLVNVPIGVMAVAMSLARVEESRMSQARKPDPLGVVTFTGALAALVYALIEGDRKGWNSRLILGCLIGAGALLILFLIVERVKGDGAMFDLTLFRKPTFTGGAVAAFGLSGGMFALLLYLTLYLQDVLGYSPLQTGVRFLVLSGGILLTSALAGRLTATVPIRFLIGPGLLLVGAGLLLMRGITPATGYSHLVPGFIVAGAGVGVINPPLASTAIGVVQSENAGMASGINSTFRQVGIATGIAGLGAIFTHQVRTKIESVLHGNWYLTSAQTHTLASSVANGNGAKTAIQALPSKARGPAVHALQAGFATGLNKLFLVAAVLSLAAALLTLLLIRSKDFEHGAAHTEAKPDEPPASDEAAEAEEAPAGPGEDGAAIPRGEPVAVPGEVGQPISGEGVSAEPVASENGGAPRISVARAGPAAPGGEVTASPVDQAPAGSLDESAAAPDNGVLTDSVDEPANTATNGALAPADDAAAASPAGDVPAPPEDEASVPPVTGYLAERLYGRGSVRVLRAGDKAEPESEGSPEGPSGETRESAAALFGTGSVSDALQRRMAGYGYRPRSPVPPPPPPPPLAGPGPGLTGAFGGQPSESEPSPGHRGGPEPPSEIGVPSGLDSSSGLDLVPEASSQAEPTRSGSNGPEADAEGDPSSGSEAAAPGEGLSSGSEPGSLAEPSPYVTAAIESASEPPEPDVAPPSDPSATAPHNAPDPSSRQDIPMSLNAPAPGAPNTRDVRQVAQAVQSAEEAAMAYAREIAEARRHLASAIEHLDSAEQARSILNGHATGLVSDSGLGGSAAGSASGSSAVSGPGSAPDSQDLGAPRATGPMSTPSPGIAIAQDDPSTPNQPGSPPPRPGGWGLGGSGTP